MNATPPTQPGVTQQALLHCPFCGPGNSVPGTWFDDVHQSHRVGCGRCGCSTGFKPGQSEADAIAAWNRRQQSAQPVGDAVLVPRWALEFALNDAQNEEHEMPMTSMQRINANAALRHALLAPSAPVVQGEAVAWGGRTDGERYGRDGFNTGPWNYRQQPGNVTAWAIGEACRKAADDPNCGDYIDRGLILLRELQTRGYGICALGVIAPAAAVEARAVDGDAATRAVENLRTLVARWDADPFSAITYDTEPDKCVIRECLLLVEHYLAASSPPAPGEGTIYDRARRMNQEAANNEARFTSWADPAQPSPQGGGEILNASQYGLTKKPTPADEAREKDAARYRWLANRVLGPDYGDNDEPGLVNGWFICGDLRDGKRFMFGGSIDEAIDAAIAADAAKQGGA